MARNDRRSRALLRGLRRQARRGNLTAREQRDLLDQEELFRQARRENAPLTTAAVLAGAGLLGTPGGRAALGEFTGMDPESRLKRQMERDKAKNVRGMQKDALDDLRQISRDQDELDRLEMRLKRAKEMEEGLAGGEEETPTEIVDEPKTIEAKAVPMEDVAESNDRELDEIVMLPEVEVVAESSDPVLDAFNLPDGTFLSSELLDLLTGGVDIYGDPRRRQEHGGIVDPERRADRVLGRAQDTLMRVVEAEQVGKEKLGDRLLGRYMRQLQRYDDLRSRVPFEGGLDDYLAPPPGQLGPIQPMEPYSNPEFDEQMEEYGKKMEEYEKRKVKPSGSSMQFGGQTPKMQDFMQKIARKYGIK